MWSPNKQTKYFLKNNKTKLKLFPPGGLRRLFLNKQQDLRPGFLPPFRLLHPNFFTIGFFVHFRLQGGFYFQLS